MFYSFLIHIHMSSLLVCPACDSAHERWLVTLLLPVIRQAAIALLGDLPHHSLRTAGHSLARLAGILELQLGTFALREKELRSAAPSESTALTSA